MRKSTKRIAFGAAVVVAASGAGVAFAAWTSTGTGTGSAKAGRDTPVTTSANAESVSLLYPGGSGDVALTINNDNPYPVHVTAINGNGDITSGNAGCTAATNGVTYTNQTNGSTGWTVAAHGSLAVKLTGSIAMSNASVDACQDAVFTVPVTVVAASAA